MKIDQALVEATRTLAHSNIHSPRLTAELLLAHHLGIERPRLYSRRREMLSDRDRDALFALVGRRAAGEPLQYITGIQEFYGRDFRVNPDVLIPRPETELVVETVLRLNRRKRPAILDVGTGSGCIAVTLALELDGAFVLATDISPRALEVARANAAAHAASVSFAAMDRLSAVARRFDFIVSNPPYVEASEYAGLQREVRDHEPPQALVAETGAVRFYEDLVAEAGRRLADEGVLVLEIGYSMEAAVRTLFGEDWRLHPTRTDLQGIPRVIAAMRR